MKRSRTNISYVLSLLLTIFLSIFIVLTATRLTITNPAYLQANMAKANFYQEAVANLNDYIQQETQSTGFPLEMFAQYLDEESTAKLLENHLLQAFSTGEIAIDSSSFATKLNDDINEYLTSANIIINNEEQIAIQTLKDNLIDYYQTYLTFPYLDLVIKIVNQYNHYYPIIAIALIILIALCGTLLYRLYSHYRGRRRYFAYSLISTGLIALILPSFVYFGKYVNKISLSPQYFYNFVTTTINTYLLSFIVVGTILIISGYLIAYLKFKK